MKISNDIIKPKYKDILYKMKGKIMKKIKIKQLIFLLLITLAIIIPNSVRANTLTLKPDKETLKLGESTMVTISSDSKGRVNLKINDNGDLPGDRVSLNNDSQAFKVTAKKEGKITLTAIPQNPMTKDGNNIKLDSVTCTITVKGEKVEEDKDNKKNKIPKLSNLGIKPNDFKGFSPDKKNYEVTVPENVESIEIYATNGDEEQKIQGIGKKDLKIGENKFEIIVSSKEGEENNYIINITREGTIKDEEQKEIEETSGNLIGDIKLGLKTLKIDGSSLNPEFNSEIYEYELKLIGEAEKLNIQTEALDESEKIEILGNENLKEGQNVVSILVSDQEGENTVTYQITVNKSLKDEKLVAKKEEIKKLIIILVGIIILTILVIKIIKKSRNKNIIDYDYDNEYTEPYVGKNETPKKEIIDEIRDEIKEEKEDKKAKKKSKSKGKRFK